MTITSEEGNTQDNLTSDQDNLRHWYTTLNSKGSVPVETWLAHMKLIETVYGETPQSISHMRPEDAYNFVLNMVRGMLREGRSFGYIEGVVKSVEEWLEYSDSTTARVKPSSRNLQEILDNEHLLPFEARVSEQLSASGVLPLIPDMKQRSRLADAASTALKQHGSAFTSGLRNLESILSSTDSTADAMLNSVDKMVNKGVEMDIGAYYLAAYSATKDQQKALEAYSLVNSLMRYIALADAFYESGDKMSLQRANRLLNEIEASCKDHLRYTIRLSVEKFWPFWFYETVIKHKILAGHSFSDKELRFFILSKSSDTPTLYCSVLDSLVANFTPNVAMMFHYNQALIDILDDYYDIEEDIATQMPNIFIMASSRPRETLRSALVEGESRKVEKLANDRILSVVEWISSRLAEISLPSEFSFLKEITADHVIRLRRELN